MALFYALAGLFTLGSYMVPVRFSRARGLHFFPFMALGVLLLDLTVGRGELGRLLAHPKAFSLCLASGVLWAFGQMAANLALEEVSLAKSTMFFSLNTLINILLGILLFHEASGAGALGKVTAGAVLLFAGIGLVASAQPAEGQKEDLKRGLPWAVLAGFFWGIYFIPIKLIPALDPSGALPSTTLLSGLALGGSLPGAVIPFGKTWKWDFPSAGAGFLSAALWAGGMAFFLLAIASWGLARAVPVVNANSLVYAAWSLWVFKEIPLSQTPKVAGGMLSAVAGIVLLSLA